jgi:hypothetical protein
MKIRSLSIALGASLMALTGTWLVHAQSKTGPTTSEIMKLKLDYAQSLLTGIATENYDLIYLNAESLSKLSRDSAWRARQTPQYELFSAEFRRHLDAISKAAKDRNLDAASLAYVQMTLSCVQCHKYMRGTKTAGLR